MSVTGEQLTKRLQSDIKRAGSQRKWAAEHDVTGQYVCDLLRGRREPGPKILAALGVRRVVAYEVVR